MSKTRILSIEFNDVLNWQNNSVVSMVTGGGGGFDPFNASVFEMKIHKICVNFYNGDSEELFGNDAKEFIEDYNKWKSGK